MTATRVESTTLATVAYDAALQRLRIEFRDQSVYQYLGVPAAVYEALLHAPSKGAYFNRSIRGRVAHTRVLRRPSLKPSLS